MIKITIEQKCCPKGTVSFFFGYHILYFALSENTELHTIIVIMFINFLIYQLLTNVFTECYCVTQSHNFHFKVAAFTAKSTAATPTATPAPTPTAPAAPLAPAIRAP